MLMGKIHVRRYELLYVMTCYSCQEMKNNLPAFPCSITMDTAPRATKTIKGEVLILNLFEAVQKNGLLFLKIILLKLKTLMSY